MHLGATISPTVPERSLWKFSLVAAMPPLPIPVLVVLPRCPRAALYSNIGDWKARRGFSGGSLSISCILLSTSAPKVSSPIPGLLDTSCLLPSCPLHTPPNCLILLGCEKTGKYTVSHVLKQKACWIINTIHIKYCKHEQYGVPKAHHVYLGCIKRRNWREKKIWSGICSSVLQWKIDEQSKAAIYCIKEPHIYLLLVVLQTQS